MQIGSTLTVDDYLQEPDVHEVYNQPVTGSFLVFVFMAILTVAHAFNLYLLFWIGTYWLVNLVIHLILVGISYVLVVLMEKSELDQRFARLGFITSSVLSVVGTLGTVLALLQSLFYLRFRSSFDEWYKTIFPRGSYDKAEWVAEELELGRDENPKNYSVIPFMDVMEVGSEAQKRNALSKMTASFHPRFSPAFKRALLDESSSIRIQAATAITRIENNFHERLLKIDRLHKEMPRNAVVLKALAEHYDDYAFTSLLDEGREKENRERAYQHYTQYLDLRPDDTTVHPRIGRLLIRMGRDDEAIRWIKRCLDEGYTSDTMKLWYIEVLFRTGQYELLRQAASNYQLNAPAFAQDMQQEIADSIYLWTQAGLSEKQQRNTLS